VVNWTRFDPAEFGFEFNEEKLAAHGVTVEEAAEVLWNGFVPLRDKDYEDRYVLLGRTDSGRALKLVAVVLGKTRLRIITGWPR
jgi:uncharacterized DUF497 family protein